MHFYMLASSIKTQITTKLVTFGGRVLKTVINQDIYDTFVTSAYDIIVIYLIPYQQRKQFCLEWVWGYFQAKMREHFC